MSLCLLPGAFGNSKNKRKELSKEVFDEEMKKIQEKVPIDVGQVQVRRRGQAQAGGPQHA